jgi:hypothetical protein
MSLRTGQPEYGDTLVTLHSSLLAIHITGLRTNCTIDTLEILSSVRRRHWARRSGVMLDALMQRGWSRRFRGIPIRVA